MPIYVGTYLQSSVRCSNLHIQPVSQIKYLKVDIHVMLWLTKLNIQTLAEGGDV